MRVYVRGRDIDPDGVAETAFERYRLEVWPEDVSPETHFRLTDHAGAEGRGSLARNAALPEPPPIPTETELRRHMSLEELNTYVRENLRRDREPRDRGPEGPEDNERGTQRMAPPVPLVATSRAELADAGGKQRQTPTTALTDCSESMKRDPMSFDNGAAGRSGRPAMYAAA